MKNLHPLYIHQHFYLFKIITQPYQNFCIVIFAILNNRQFVINGNKTYYTEIHVRRFICLIIKGQLRVFICSKYILEFPKNNIWLFSDYIQWRLLFENPVRYFEFKKKRAILAALEIYVHIFSNNVKYNIIQMIDSENRIFFFNPIFPFLSRLIRISASKIPFLELFQVFHTSKSMISVLLIFSPLYKACFMQ